MSREDVEAEYQQILFLGDTIPSSGAWGEDRRALRLFADVRSLLPRARLTHVATDSRAGIVQPPWAVHLGVELAGQQGDWRAWLSDRRFSFSLIVLTGNGSAHRLIENLRRTQPQASIVGLLPWLAPLEVGAERRFPAREEQLGALLSGGHLRDRDAALLAALDGVLCAGEDDLVRSRLDGPGVPLFHYPTAGHVSAGERPGLDSREGILSWGSFGKEQGDPDEEAALLADCSLRSLLESSCPTEVLTVALEKAPWGLRRLEPAGSKMSSELRRAKVLVVARTFGAPADADALVLEAADAGTPVVALAGSVSSREGCTVAADVADMARLTRQLTSDVASWEEARRRLDAWWAARTSPANLDGLVAMLGLAGLAAVRGKVVVALPAEDGESLSGMRTVQGQVQTPGLVQHRPTELPFARADMAQDQLWPVVAYEGWFSAHPLTDRARADMTVRAARFAFQPLVSVLMPVYDTGPDILEEALDSVLAQAYPLWELCVVDDGSTNPGTVRKLTELAARDDRVRLSRLDENQGIVSASNIALGMAKGEFVALLDHDDRLTPDALFEVVALLNEEADLDYLYSDEDKLDVEGRRRDPFFKPSWSPHLHLGVNYVTHLSVYRRSLLDVIGGFRAGYDGSQDYDLSLRATEVARRVGHIAKPIYSWRMVPGSAATAHDAKPYALDSARRALADALARRGIAGRIEPGAVAGTWRPRYEIQGDPLVSILIPTRNGRRLLERCFESIVERTAYRNFEFVIVDNGSDDPRTLDYLGALKARVVRYPYRFNYARQMNLAVTAARGDLVLFLNDDMEIISPDWLESMVEIAQQDMVGAVGARLVFPDGRVQHEGVFVGFGGGSAGNVDFGGYFDLGRMIRDASAVTAACMMMRVEPFRLVGGFDERLRVAFNDVDLCLRLRQRGYQIVYTPHAELVHVESASRGNLHPEEDEAFFVRRWGPPGDFPDPFYNPNLDPIRPFRLRR